jgi:hypothetical protein
MCYTRRVSEADAVDSGYPHYRVVMAASPESATVLGCFLGNAGPLSRRRHRRDHRLRET